MRIRSALAMTTVLTFAGLMGCASAAQAKVAAGSSSARPWTTSLTGKVYALGIRADPARRTITFDKIDWFFGDAASAACKADKKPIPPAAWCNDYYFRNRNPLQRTVSLAGSARVTLADYDSTASPVPQKRASLRELDKRFADSETILVLTIRRGVITAVREQFTP